MLVNTNFKAYDPAIHHRRSIRLQGHDYAGGGVYFVTLCLADHRPLFGTVVNGRMALNDAGRAAAVCWREIPAHFPQAALDEWIVMPDHVHGIVVISGKRGEKSFAPAAAPASPISLPHGTSRTLGSIIRGFKIGVTKVLGGDSPWQRNYYDIIARDARALDNIRRYIQDNPAHWDTLRYGEPRFSAGNRALLDLPMTAFLASRTGESKDERFFAPAAPALQWLERPACVISGFLSPWSGLSSMRALPTAHPWSGFWRTACRNVFPCALNGPSMPDGF
jgi:putative transposase